MLTRKQIIDLDKKHIWHPYTPMAHYINEIDPLVVERAAGIYLYDQDGTRYIDANASWWVNLLGHNHPRLMAALCRQTERLAHCSLANSVHEPAAVLAEKLTRQCGPNYTRVFYSDNGTTAVESALRMAYQYWQNIGRRQKNRFVSLSNAFHGETIGSASVSGTAVFHKTLGPLLFDCVRLPSPGSAAAEAGTDSWYGPVFDKTAAILKKNHGKIAAVIIEPLVQGAGGMLMYPPQYLKDLHELCEKLDILVIADEVFVGYGRTGTFLAHQQANFDADIVCLAKGFSGGVLPMAATVVTDRIFSAFLGKRQDTLWYGHSFTGNPLGAAVALEVLAILNEERLIEKLPPKCDTLQQRLTDLSSHPWVRDPRRTGMIAAFTLAAPNVDRTQADYLDDAGWQFCNAARKRGAWVRPLGNVVYFVLPLTITEPQINTLFDLTRDALEELR